MPAATVANTLSLPRITPPDPATARFRVADEVVTAQVQLEGEGFQVRRPFPSYALRYADPFLLLDHMGAVEYAPGEAKGAPWHPHRGFETVTYMIDGAFEHHDSTGGGGLITNGSTQWMTAGAGILHDEVPPQELIAKGGLFHGVQLWVNLPAALKWTPPRYQAIETGDLTLLSSADGGALVRVIAGRIGEFSGPGSTWTPIAYAHATVYPGARLELPWQPEFNAFAYVLSGEGTIGANRRPLREGQLAVLGAGDALNVEALPTQSGRAPTLELLLLGGAPIREPAIFHGPFVMNTREEIVQAIQDYHAGRMGRIPATILDPRPGCPPASAN
jgi:quercetin 2,3-dioxygenase